MGLLRLLRLLRIDKNDDEKDGSENTHDGMKEEDEENKMFGEKVQDFKDGGSAHPIAIEEGDIKSEEQC